jgi:hypothetical protein
MAVISRESEPGRFTCFLFTFRQNNPSKVYSENSNDSRTQRNHQPAKILVVDDDREMPVPCRFIGRGGLSSETVHDGRRRWKDIERAASI